MRSSRGLIALTVPALMVAGLAAPGAALAADDCPNADVRAQQPYAQSLPHCMAFEKVTPDDKYGALVKADAPMLADGTGIAIWSNLGMDGAPNGHEQLGHAFRGPDGWSTRFLTPTNWGWMRASNTADFPRRQATALDFGAMIYQTSHPIDPGDRGEATPRLPLNTIDLYQANPDGTHTWITAPASGEVTGTLAGSNPSLWGTAPNLAYAVFSTTRVMDPSVDTTVRAHVWMSRDGQPPELVDRLPDGSVSNPTTVPNASNSGLQVTNGLSRIAFLSTPAGSTRQLYVRIDAGTPQARTVLASANDSGAPCPAGNLTFDSLSEDGRYVRFFCAGAMTPDAPAGGGYYVRDLEAATLTYDEPLPTQAVESTSQTWNRPEGRYRVESRLAPAPRRIWRVDRQTGEEVCVSCPADGSPPTAISEFGGQYGASAIGTVSPEGDVVFQTPSALVPEDRNGFTDVYLWKDGQHVLLSPGSADSDVELGGMSLDGSTVSFSTTAALVPEDRDNGARDVYVARRGGGWVRETPPTECALGCQGAGSPPGPVVQPLSLAFPTTGNVEDRDEEQEPIRLSGSRSVRGSTIKLRVRIPEGGRISASGFGLRKVTRTIKRGTTATLNVRISARSKRLLTRRSSLRLRATVRYASDAGRFQSKRVAVTFRSTAKQRAAARRAASAKTRTSDKTKASASAGEGVR